MGQRYPAGTTCREHCADARKRIQWKSSTIHAAVVHCAAQPSHDWAAKDVFTDFSVNANGTLNDLIVVVREIASSIQTAYIWAIPVGVLAFVLSLTLPEIKLRASLHPIADEIPLSNADPIA